MLEAGTLIEHLEDADHGVLYAWGGTHITPSPNEVAAE
jgi:hypothetical protein